jgi:periplasmic divalent cation tolerance protein
MEVRRTPPLMDLPDSPAPAPVAGPPPLVLALTTEADEARAEALARHLLEQRLVACVGLWPVRSLYRWQGALEESREVQLLLKTHPDRLEALRQAVLERHSYSTPEWITWFASAAPAYGAWAAEAVLPERQESP